MNNILSDEVLDTIDEELRRIIKKIYNKGYTTSFSCSGHPVKRLQISKILVVIIMVNYKKKYIDSFNKMDR